MKRNIVILIMCVIMMLIGGCTNISTDNDNTEPDYKAKASTLENKLDNYNKIYDPKIKKSIDKYCKYFLSFENRIDTRNVKKLKKYLTSDLYDKLLNQPYNENIDKEQGYYLQNTSADKLYYEDISQKNKYSPIINETEVLAICSQSVVFNNNTTFSYNVYKFKMNYRSNQWLISSIENIK